jgi:tripartite-type tricarboxylate transporter receptor subunit TctC
MLHSSRRDFLWTAAAPFAAVLLPAGAAFAQTYPARPIRLVVGYPAGGGADKLARVLASQLGTELGQSVVVDNRPGATGNIAAAGVAHSPADGYTLLLSETGMIAGSILHPSGYDAVKSFSVVTSIGSLAFSIVCTPSFPAQNVPQLIAYLKANPGKINYGTPGNGNVAHLAALQFQRRTGTSMNHIPYKGGAPMLTDLVAGQFPIAFISVSGADALAKAGRIRYLALTSAEKLSNLPDVPTVAATVPGFDVSSNLYVLAPAGTPRSIVDALHAAVAKAVSNPTMAAEFQSQGATIRISAPETARRTMSAETVELAKLIREEKVQAD